MKPRALFSYLTIANESLFINQKTVESVFVFTITTYLCIYLIYL